MPDIVDIPDVEIDSDAETISYLPNLFIELRFIEDALKKEHLRH